MKRELFAAGVVGLAGLGLIGRAWGEDLVTLSGTTYRDVQPVRVEPDGVTWRYDGGAVKVDFADSPEAVRRAYRYDPAKATAYRDAQARGREQAEAQARHDAAAQETRQRARAQAAIVQVTAGDAEAVTVFRRALSPAASNATRQMAARMQEDVDKRATEAAANPDRLKLIPTLPSALGPRPINPFMDTPNAAEYQAALHHSPSNAAPPAVNPDFSSVNNPFFDPMYLSRSYYEDVDRAEAFARGVPLK